MEGIFTILVFVGVIAVTALIFGVWIVSMLVRTVARGVGAIFSPDRGSRLPPMPSATRGVICANSNCRATNPEMARFCRRCGSELPQAQHVSVHRRVAIW